MMSNGADDSFKAKMQIKETDMDGVFVIELEKHADNRGYFSRLFCHKELYELLEEKNVVQVNFSNTKKRGTVRGLHFQHPPFSEKKIIKCITGRVFDVIVDLRINSPTFLQSVSLILSKDDNKMIFIPEGCAHGFQTIEDDSELLYFHTEFYNPIYEDGIRYDEPKLKIDWPLEITEISERDRNHKLLNKEFKGIKL